jgi:hypothetical protein
MSCKAYDGALDWGENFWQASHVVMFFDSSSTTKGWKKPCLKTMATRATESMFRPQVAA